MPDEPLTPEEIKTAEELAKVQKELAWQLTRAGVDAVTIVDPTGLSNIPAMGMSIYDGDFIGAGLSLVGLIPLLGKLSDIAKEARATERIAELGKTVLGLSSKLNKLGKLRAEAKIAKEAALAAKVGKEAGEARTAAKAAKNAVTEAKAAPKAAKARCIPCEKAAAERAAVEKAAANKPFPPIKRGSAGGNSAKKPFPKSIKNKAIKENPERICVYCRRPTKEVQIDHSIPKSRGGNATVENAQVTCPHCNASKGANDYPKSPPSGYKGPWPPPWWPKKVSK